MNNAASFLPHTAPAILLQRFEDDATGTSLRAWVRLAEIASPWMLERGMPAAFSLEILGQASAVFLRLRDTEDRLRGGRLAACDSYSAQCPLLGLRGELEAEVTHLGGSQIGYHKFRGSLSESGRCLVEAEFSVYALRRNDD